MQVRTQSHDTTKRVCARPGPNPRFPSGLRSAVARRQTDLVVLEGWLELAEVKIALLGQDRLFPAAAVLAEYIVARVYR